MMTRFIQGAVAAAALVLLAGCEGDDGAAGAAGPPGAAGAAGPAGVPNAVTVTDVVTSNANIAFAAYGDSLTLALALQDALQTFVAAPTAANFAAAKQAWLDSNEPYGQTEVYRFRVGPIDALLDDGSIGMEGDGPEGAINAWPLAEALIDYVANNVDGDAEPEVASSTATIAGSIIEDTATFATIDASVVRANNELGGDERNVASGYHVIEFLLWGQDLNADLSGTGARDATPGQRPVSDYDLDPGDCTSGPNAAADAICVRRGQYLLATVEVLIEDLQSVTEAWSPSIVGNHYENFVAGGETSLATILEGMGRLGFGELAGERMNIALLTNSQEDEHSCFSDNTHRDIVTNAKGIANSFFGSYTRIDGTLLEGAGIDDLLVSQGETDLANQMRAALERTEITVEAIDQSAKQGVPFDNLIQIGINEPTVATAIAALSAQTDILESVIVGLNLTTGDLRQDTDQDI